MQPIISINYSIIVFFTYKIAESFFNWTKLQMFWKKIEWKNQIPFKEIHVFFWLWCGCDFVDWKQKDKKYNT